MAYHSSDVAAGDTGEATQYNNLRLDATEHIENQTAPVHGSASAATPSKLVHRDANGRTKMAAPSASDDVAIKSTVDTVQTNLNTHANLTNPHLATDAATASRLVLRDASGRAKIATPAVAADIANFESITTVERFTALSDVVNHNNPTQRSKYSESYTKIKEIKVNENLNLVRLSCEAKYEMGGGSSSYTNIAFYKNGVKISSDLNVGTSGYVTYTFDIAGGVSSDDLLQIYCKASSSPPGLLYVRNFELRYDNEITHIGLSELEAPIICKDRLLNVTNQDPA